MKDLFKSPTNKAEISVGKDKKFFQTIFTNWMMFSNAPVWQRLEDIQSLFDWYHVNPVFYSVVNIKAREYGNMRIKVLNKNTGQCEDVNTKKAIPKALYNRFDNPNVLQARGEYFRQGKIFQEVAGNGFRYGNFTIGMKSIEHCAALWNVWPAMMQFMLAGKYFEATDISEIIKNWKFELGNYKKVWEPHEILHTNNPNTDLRDSLIFGRSTARSLLRPLSNIDMAYESRNVIMKNRGMRVILTSAKGDASGQLPLQDHEISAVQKAMEEYGMREGQKQFFFTHMPVTAVPIDQDVSKLGLFEEIATDAMVVCNAYGVPEILLKLYIKGTTFENQEASVRRLYQGTLTPEAEEEMIAYNKFLNLADTDWMLWPTFDHVAVLQESEEKKQKRQKDKSDQLLAEFAKGLLTLEEYREEMGYGPLPVVEDQEAPKSGADTKTLEAQAELRGSVGGVQGILAIQSGVVQGQTTYDSGLAMLTILYGFTDEQARQLLGNPTSNETNDTADQAA